MPNLLFCMTPGVELNAWQLIGSMNRELRPYEEYVKRGWNVKVLTFDKGEIPKLPEGIEAVRFSDPRLLWFLPWTHKELGQWADVIKTNQSVHAYFYTLAAEKWQKPILLRCGYVQGEYLETTVGLTAKVRFYQWLEAKAFQQATHCQIPTRELSEWVQNRYGVSGEKISVIPNFVDTEVFKPMPEVMKSKTSVISVGRLEPVKQFDLLIRACAEIPGCQLTLVGEGSERQKLENLAKELKVNLSLPGNMPNENLPEILNRNQIFAITSLREGHPKALIEAMACGIPCLAVKAKGLENQIRHGENGWLTDADVRGIRDGLILLLGDGALSDKISTKAWLFSKSTYNFANIMENEFKILGAFK